MNAGFEALIGAALGTTDVAAPGVTDLPVVLARPLAGAGGFEAVTGAGLAGVFAAEVVAFTKVLPGVAGGGAGGLSGLTAGAVACRESWPAGVDAGLALAGAVVRVGVVPSAAAATALSRSVGAATARSTFPARGAVRSRSLVRIGISLMVGVGLLLGVNRRGRRQRRGVQSVSGRRG